MNTPSNSPQSNREEAEIKASNKANLIRALIFSLGFGVASGYLHSLENHDKDAAEVDLSALEIKAKQQTLSTDEVKKYHASHGTDITDARAKVIYKSAKAQMDEITKRIEAGEMVEGLPGAHFEKGKVDSAAALSEIARKVLVDGDNEPTYVLTANGERQLGTNKEPLVAAKPFAEALTEVNEEMKKDGKGELKIRNCDRTDIDQAITKASAGNSRAGEVGESFHGAGLACDIDNRAEAQPYLAKKGIRGDCDGSMFGSDPGHFSAGEMDPKGAAFIDLCRAMPMEARSKLEKTERLTRGTRKKIGDVVGKAEEGAKKVGKKIWDWF